MYSLLTDFIEKIIHHAFKFKNKNHCFPMDTGLMVLYFEKKSTRTRLSCTRAWSLLGGTVMDMSAQDGKNHIGVNESIYDSFRVIADLAECIVARVNDHDTLYEIERAIKDSGRNVLLLNGLSDRFHPLQALADIMTMYENENKNDPYLVTMNDDEDDDDYDNNPKKIKDPRKISILREIQVTWIGDTNNVFNSLYTTLPRLGMKMCVCHPKGYGPKSYASEAYRNLTVTSSSSSCLSSSNSSSCSSLNSSYQVVFTNDPKKALKHTKYVITDTWVSMGDEKDAEKRKSDFEGYSVNNELIDNAELEKNWRFLHCLPRKKEEVSDEIFYSKRSLVFKEAENRMWTTMAMMFIWQQQRPRS
jgi:ornithine carbamoyltransferase